MPQPIADMRIRSDTGNYIGPPASFPSGTLKVESSSLHKFGVIIASGTTTDLATVDGDAAYVSGNATITSFGTVTAGVRKWLRFTGTPTLTHNATSLICVGGTNIVVNVNDRALVISLGNGNWFMLDYVRVDGTALAQTDAFITASVGGSVNNYAPIGYNSSIRELRLTCSAGATLTGLTGGSANRLVTVFNSEDSSNSPLSIVANSTSSLATNRFNFATSVPKGGSLRLRYDDDNALWEIERLSDVIVEYSRDEQKTILRPGYFAVVSGDGITSVVECTYNNQLLVSLPFGVGSLFASDASGGLQPLHLAFVSPTTIGSNQNNFANWKSLTRFSASTSVNITGIVAPASSTNYAVYMGAVNVGANAITFKHQDTGSTAINRILSVTGTDLVLNQNEFAWFCYDPTTQRWRMAKLESFDQTLNKASDVKFASLADTSGTLVLINTASSLGYVTATGKIGCVQTSVVGSYTAWMDYQSVNSPYFYLRTPLYTVALPATTGTISVASSGHVSTVRTLTPTGDCTLNAAAGGITGAKLKLVVTTSSTTNYVITFGTNFKSQGTLSTSTVSGKTFSVTFTYNGSSWVEDGRTVAM